MVSFGVFGALVGYCGERAYLASSKPAGMLATMAPPKRSVSGIGMNE